MNFFFALIIFCAASYVHALPTIQAHHILDDKLMSFELQNDKKAHVIIFLSSLCPCSNSHVEYLKKLYAENPEFEFIGIHSNADEKSDVAKEYFKAANFPFPVLKDTHSKWANEFKANRTPHSFVVDQKGDIIYEGGVTSSSNPANAENFYLKDALSAVKMGQKIELTKTRVLGCEIARN